MKSRIKKLLAAALALCLIAAMVPGAALAADTGNFSTPTKSEPETKTYHATLAEAIEYVSSFSTETNKVVTVEANSVEVSGTISGVTLNANGKDLIVNNNLAVGCKIENAGDIDVNANLTVNNGGSLEFSGTMDVATNVVVAVQGTLVNNGSIVLATGSSSNSNTALNVTGTMSGSGDITVGTNASAALPAGIEMSGDLINHGAVTMTGILTTTGTINNSGSMTANIEAEGSSEITNSGTINGTVTVDDNASLTLAGDNAKVGNLTINGTLTVTGTHEFTGNALTLNERGVLEVSSSAKVTLPSNYSFAGTINVNGGTLIMSGNEKVGSNLSGNVVVTRDGNTTVYTVKNATINSAYTVYSSNRLVVDGTLTLAAGLTVETGGALVVDGTLTINANQSLTTDTAITGDGRINVSGQLYNDNDGDADDVEIQIQGNGLVYSNSAALLGNVTNGTTTTTAAPNGKTYALSLSRGTGGTFNVKVVAGDHGSVSTTSTTGTAGSDVRITATPAAGYMVDTANTYYVNAGGGRSDSVNVNGNVCTFNMPNNDVTVYINFKEAETPDEPTGTTYSISRITSTNGTFVVNANKADAGETVTITTSPNSGYKVSRVSVTGATATKFADNVYTFTMPAQNVTVSVTFERGDYTVSLTNYPYDDGYISLRSSGTTTSGNYAEGDEVTIYAFPDRGFHLRSLTITRTDNRQTVSYTESNTSDDVFYFTMPASNVTVRAYFTDGVYEITTDIDGRGSLAIRDENGNTTDVAEEGEEIRIYPSANNGYRLGDLYVTYTDSDDEDQTIDPEAEYNSRDVLQYYWFEMPEYDVEIYADFGEGDYVAWIDRNNIEHGSIRVSPNVADEDDTVSVYVTPDSGYQLDELVVEDEDGRDVSTTALASGTRYTFRMPDSDVTISATFRSRNYTSNFTDVPRTEWYYEAVSYVATEGLMNGVSTTQFNPNGTASRAQIVTILWRLAGEPSALTGAFTDVPAGEYYSTAVAWASRQGIVTGVGNNRFEPNSNITREQLAVILYRYAQDAGYSTTASGSITGYYDYARVNGYARTALQWAVGTGLITGTSSTTLSPQDTATRAQVATILMRFCENIVR